MAKKRNGLRKPIDACQFLVHLKDLRPELNTRSQQRVGAIHLTRVHKVKCKR